MVQLNRYRVRVVAVLMVLWFCGSVSLADEPRSLDPYANETPEQRDERMAWFREAKFGMFIHWGVYAVPAGTHNGERVRGIGEWIMLNAKIPVADYKAYAKQFNPTQYDPDAWVRLAKAAGMKYIVITSKHHDGFALFDSKVSEWDVVDATPYGKDLLKPLAEACRKHGMKLGFYYSQAQDWNQGGSAMRGKWDPAQPTDMDVYLREIAVPQVKEILTQYGDIAVLWWDTPFGMTQERADLLIPLVGLQPGIIYNNRLGGGYEGDIKTPEQHVPGTGLSGDWESCMTMNRTWGFKSYDHDWKSSQTLIRNLIDIASKGGNYLLNVGPTAEGLIPQPSIERLNEIGQWMDLNGETIYGTTASPCRIPEWGRITTKAGEDRSTLYLHVFDWNDGGEIFLPVDNPVLGCQLYVDPSRVFSTTHEPGRGLTVKLTGSAPDPIASVIELQIAGPPVRAKIDYLRIDGQEKFDLPLDQVTFDEASVARCRYDKKSGRVVRWGNDSSRLVWEFYVDDAGRYAIEVETAGKASTMMAAQIAGQQVQAQLPATDSNQLATNTLGEIEIAEPGVYSLMLLPVKGQWTEHQLGAARLVLQTDASE